VLDSIRLLGQAGVPCLGYNFSLAGVWGHVTGPFARGRAESIGFEAEAIGPQPEIPVGQVWNMDFGDVSGGETIGAVNADEVWARFEAFLTAAVPVAESAGVRLCAHPDDPPVSSLRHTARVLTSEAVLQRLLDFVPSRANSLEFCQGTVAEMPDVDIYDAIARSAEPDRLRPFPQCHWARSQLSRGVR
jgi:mannonate dehydratase